MVQAKTDWVWGEQTAWAKALGVSQQLINGIVTGRFRKHYKT
jgi:DNA-binding transcriptional regulator YdaS (Cro superfamily)